MQPDKSADACSCGCQDDKPALRLVHSVNEGPTRSRGLHDVYRPIAEVNPDIERAMRKVTEADIHGAFGGIPG